MANRLNLNNSLYTRASTKEVDYLKSKKNNLLQKQPIYTAAAWKRCSYPTTKASIYGLDQAARRGVTVPYHHSFECLWLKTVEIQCDIAYIDYQATAQSSQNFNPQSRMAVHRFQLCRPYYNRQKPTPDSISSTIMNNYFPFAEIKKRCPKPLSCPGKRVVRVEATFSIGVESIHRKSCKN